jgi:hypothetical protein
MKVSIATVAVWLAFAPDVPTNPPSPPPIKCCGKCGGTGMVPTGDGITRVWCSCPAACPCAKNRPKPQSACKDGACHAK